MSAPSHAAPSPRRAAPARLLAALAALAAVTVSHAPAADVEPRRRLAGVRQEIERLDAERSRLAAEERGILGKLERLAAEARLFDARLEELELESEAARAEADALDAELALASAELETEREAFRATVLMLHRVGPLGRMRPLLEVRDAERVAGALRLASELTRRQREQVEGLRGKLARLAALKDERTRAFERLDALRAETAGARAALSKTMRERQALLDGVRSARATRERAIGELERAAGELEEIVRGARPAEGWSSGLSVRAFRGLLPMPARGDVVERFGRRRDPRFGTELPHPGWDIDAPFGADVRAPFEGVVAWTGWLRGYGLVVVLDHGENVHSVYAHLSIVVAQKGQPVAQGQSIGKVGDTGSLKGAFLYFEVRENGKAVDPARWIDPSRRSG